MGAVEELVVGWSVGRRILAVLMLTVFFSVIIPPEASNALESVIVLFFCSRGIYLACQKRKLVLFDMILFVCRGLYFTLCITDLMLGWWLLHAVCNCLAFALHAEFMLFV